MTTWEFIFSNQRMLHFLYIPSRLYTVAYIAYTLSLLIIFKILAYLPWLSHRDDEKRYYQFLSVIIEYFLHNEIYMSCNWNIHVLSYLCSCLSWLYGLFRIIWFYGYIFMIIPCMCAFHTHIDHIFNMLAQL
jgi:hypothetical protein